MAKKGPILQASKGARAADSRAPLVGESGDPTPPAIRSRRLPLKTVEHVHRQLADVYRRALQGAVAPDGSIAPGTATRLAMILSEVRRCIVDHDLEDRIAALEAKETTP